MEADNLTKQIEEIEAMTAIYGSEWRVESETSRSYSITIVDGSLEVILTLTLPPEYPAQSPPHYEFSAPWMDRKAKEMLRIALDGVCLNNKGETVIYQWVETIREMLQETKQTGDKKVTETQEQEVDSELPEADLQCSEIAHGEVIVDRKSSFQGHAAEVHSVEDVHTVLKILKQNKKIANAFHNMFAYRIERDRGGDKLLVQQDCDDDGESHAGGDKLLVQQDCDDDGESHAGGRMLHLLEILDVKNVLVVVSRWYGGIQLGPDRFRHINNCTRQVLLQAGFIKK